MSTVFQCFERSRCAAAAVLVFAIGSAACPVARAVPVDLANNLAEASAGYLDLFGGLWSAQGFATTATDSTIGAVTVPMRRDPGVTSGALQLFIYDATGDGGRPGSSVTGETAVGSFLFDAVPTTTANVTFTGLNLSLNPSTNYFVVLKTPGLVGGSFRWDYTNSTGGLGFPSPFAGSLDSGASWFTPSLTDPQQMQVVAVPEPATAAMTLIGLACGSYALVRRRTAAVRATKRGTPNAATAPMIARA
ncbi:MAG: PEP-CTERM sorting domain-containing protein [Planctomycetia bacterium]